MFIVQTKHHVNVRLDMDSCRILYGIAFTIEMSKKEDHQIAGFCYQGRFRLGCQESYGKEKQDFSKLSDRSVETCEAYRRGRACGSLPFHLISF